MHAAGDHRRRGPRVLQAQRRRPQGRRPGVRGQQQRLPASRAPPRSPCSTSGCRSPTRRPTRRTSSTPPKDTPKRKVTRDEVRAAGREGAHQGPDPRALPQHRAVRQRRLRRLRRQPGLLRQEAQGPQRSRRRRCSPAWSRRPIGVQPDHRRAATRRRWTAATTSSTTWSRPSAITAEQAAAAKAVKLDEDGQARRQRLRLRAEEQLGLLLRLLLPLVAEPGGVRRRPRTTGSGGSRAAATGSSPRWT